MNIKDLVENKVAVLIHNEEQERKINKIFKEEDYIIGENRYTSFPFYRAIGRNWMPGSDNGKYYKDNKYQIIDFSELELDEIINDFQIY